MNKARKLEPRSFSAPTAQTETKWQKKTNADHKRAERNRHARVHGMASSQSAFNTSMSRKPRTREKTYPVTLSHMNLLD